MRTVRCGRCYAKCGGPRGDVRGHLAERGGDPVHTPRQDLFQRRDRHRCQFEKRALPLVVAACPRLIGVAIVDETGEVLRARSGDPVLLQRLSLTMLRGGPQVAPPEGPEQPLVANADEEVRLYSSDVKRQRAKGLTDVDGKFGAAF